MINDYYHIKLKQGIVFLLMGMLPGLEAAKGGAKTMIRKKNQQSSMMNTHVGYHGHASQRDKHLQG